MKWLKYLIYKTKILNLLYRLFWIFPIKNNKIICSNMNDRYYGENPKYIIEEIIRQNKNIDVVWIYRGNKEFPNNIRCVKPNTLQYFYEMATAKFWLFNTRKKSFLVKRKNQCYIQTWHGNIPLKKVEKDAIETLDINYIINAKNDSKDIDLFLSSNTFFTDIIKKSFWYNGEILECGSPKNDIFIKVDDNECFKRKVYLRLNLKEEYKILLYAPTFRDNYSHNPYDLNIDKILDTLENQTQQKWIAIARFHSKTKENEQASYTSKRIFNNELADTDITEIIMASDFIITDYSSIMFDGMISNKPVILYTKDINEYGFERGLYFNFSELPFEFANNNDDMIELIRKYDYKAFIKKYQEFAKKIGLKEKGEASWKVSKYILENINNE